MSAEFIQFYHIEDILLNSNLMYYILRSVEYGLFEKITDHYTNDILFYVSVLLDRKSVV